MRGKRFSVFGCLLVMVLLVGPASAEARLGKLLGEALESRRTAPVAEVSARFFAAAESTSNPQQRANVLFLLSDYLLDHGEWEQAIALHQRLLAEGDPQTRAPSLYALIWAHLELGQLGQARAVAAELKATPEAEPLLEHARNLQAIAPHGVHGQIGDLLAATAGDHDGLTLPGEPRTKEVNLAAILATAKSPSPVSPQVWTPPENFPLYAPPPRVTPPSESKDRDAGPEKSPWDQVIIQAGGWNSDLSGEIDSQGMSLDFDNDVSTERETSLVLSAQVPLTRKDNVKVSYANFSFAGTLNKTVVHKGKTFLPGDTFRLRTVFFDLQGFHEWKHHPRMTWGFLYGAVFTNPELEVMRNTAGVRRTGTWDSRFAYPYLGLAARSIGRGHLGWDASIKWLSWSGTGRFNTHDLEMRLLLGAGASDTTNAELFGFLGYRDFRWNGDFDDESGGVHYSGPIFGLEYRF